VLPPNLSKTSNPNNNYSSKPLLPSQANNDPQVKPKIAGVNGCDDENLVQISNKQHEIP
jgi:hypothetical protein